MNQPGLSIQKDEIWCPKCQCHTRFLKISKAAEIADVDRRSVYRYVESGDVYSVKIAGKTLRVCAGCLFKPEKDSLQ